MRLEALEKASRLERYYRVDLLIASTIAFGNFTEFCGLEMDVGLFDGGGTNGSKPLVPKSEAAKSNARGERDLSPLRALGSGEPLRRRRVSAKRGNSCC